MNSSKFIKIMVFVTFATSVTQVSPKEHAILKWLVANKNGCLAVSVGTLTAIGVYKLISKIHDPLLISNCTEQDMVNSPTFMGLSYGLLITVLTYCALEGK